ncbi:MAG: 23S rRNA (guanosine(2251)-2'-O)-methyltransferase RlmB [Bacteroidetes bacterium]|nr:23S rRNA (guanosine(2251)-2'-O)-methyltransferase RlmB [Bacteroidota bacterium]
MNKNIEVYGLRSIIEAIDSSKEISKVLLIKSSSSSILFRSLVEKLEKESIKYSYVPKEKFNKYKNKNHQGAVAILSPVPLMSIEELIKLTYNESKQLTYLLLDGITDTRNFGAIIRTSVAAGVTGIIISQNNSAPINSDVIKTSSGAAFKIPISKVQNLKDAIIHLRSLEINVFSLSEKATKSIYDINYNRSVGLIMGSEEKGITKGILKLSDETLKVPINPNIDSLNVSVAFAVVIFEIARQRIS